jgi:hypothetical protein
MEVYLHAFLISALVGFKWSVSRPDRFTTGKEAPDTHWIGGWFGPRVSLDATAERKNPAIPEIEPRSSSL